MYDTLKATGKPTDKVTIGEPTGKATTGKVAQVKQKFFHYIFYMFCYVIMKLFLSYYRVTAHVRHT